MRHIDLATLESMPVFEPIRRTLHDLEAAPRRDIVRKRNKPVRIARLIKGE